MKRLAHAVGALLLAAACSGEAEAPKPATPPNPNAPADGAAPDANASAGAAESPGDRVARGRSVYAATCSACHGPDPRQAGSLGPEISDASRELIEVRVLRAEYPPGYTPKRDSTLMIAMPHLESEIDALVAYLESLDGE